MNNGRKCSLPPLNCFYNLVKVKLKFRRGGADARFKGKILNVRRSELGAAIGPNVLKTFFLLYKGTHWVYLRYRTEPPLGGYT